MDSKTYHLQELSIANDPKDPRRVLPPIDENYRLILDLGCGAGQILVASELSSDVMAIGVDIDHSALKLGKELSKKVHFVCARGENLPIKGECLDFVYSRVSLPYMNLHRTLSEISRVLKEGGKIWLVLHPFGMSLKDLFRNLAHLRTKSAVYRLYVLANGLFMHAFGKELALPFRNHHYESCQTIRGITRALSKAGYVDIEIDKSKFLVATAKKMPIHFFR